jgi:hypothetical protein
MRPVSRGSELMVRRPGKGFSAIGRSRATVVQPQVPVSACSRAASSSGSFGAPSGVVKSSGTLQVSVPSALSVGAKPAK